MNTLVINGSPKGESSNTMKLANAFLEGMGCTDAQILNVASTKIEPCLGCFSCWNKTPGTCVIRDEMDEVLRKIIVADVIIWAFPLYSYSVPGGLKNLIDRQLPLILPFMSEGNESGGHPSRYDLSHQRHVVISTCGFWTSKGNYNAVNFMFNHHTHIYCGQGELFSIPELKSRTDAYLETVKRAGAEFIAGDISQETQAELEVPLFPREVFEKMADASWGVAEHDGAPSDDSLSFTTQMAALYKPDGVDRILEIHYTDINKTYQIILTPQGSELITDSFIKYTTRIETPLTVWKSIARGEISGQDSLFQRQYIVQGDFEIMLRWNELFGSSVPNKAIEKKRKRKCNMAVLLAPWIVIWITFAINATIGGVAGVIAAASLPLLWLVFQPVVFEQISVFAVALLSLAVLMGADIHIVSPLSYAVFGMMWLAGTFTKTPLTAYYSATNYGGESAFQNPLFMRTNRILSAAWGILYLLTSIWTYLLMGTRLAAYTGLLNSIIPALMGIFTAWFQKWYPARWARGIH